MISIVKGALIPELLCHSGETYPTVNVTAGTKITETDTGKVSIFDGAAWWPIVWPVTIAGSLPIGANDIGKVHVQAWADTLMIITTSALTATNTGVNLDGWRYRELAIDINISAVSGTTPTYQLMVERLGGDGIWYNIYTGTIITAIGVISLNLGIGAPINVSFGNVMRIREVIGGTSPSFTRSASMIAK